MIAPVSDDTEVTVTAGDITPPTVSSITDNDADDLVAVGTTVIYTVTFSEDINETTVSTAFSIMRDSNLFDRNVSAKHPLGYSPFLSLRHPLAHFVCVLPTTATIADVAGNALVVRPTILDAETSTSMALRHSWFRLWMVSWWDQGSSIQRNHLHDNLQRRHRTLPRSLQRISTNAGTAAIAVGAMRNQPLAFLALS